jgi:hypothetical protein
MADESISIPRHRRLTEKASNEFKRFLAIFLYLWVVFGLLSIHKSVVLSQNHLNYPEHAFAIVNAFVFAKVLLIGEHFRLGTRFSDKPLIYPILHKCFIFTVVLLCFHIAESVLLGLWRGNTIANSFSSIGGRRLKDILSVTIMCCVASLPFSGFREIGRVVGRKELWFLIVKRTGSDLRITLLDRQ